MNYDGKNEELEVKISVAGINPAEVQQVLVIQTLAYALREKVDIDFKMPVYNVFETPYGFSSLSVSGELQLKQKESLALGSASRQIGFESVYDLGENLLWSGGDPRLVLRHYSA